MIKVEHAKKNAVIWKNNLLMYKPHVYFLVID